MLACIGDLSYCFESVNYFYTLKSICLLTYCNIRLYWISLKYFTSIRIKQDFCLSCFQINSNLYNLSWTTIRQGCSNSRTLICSSQVRPAYMHLYKLSFPFDICCPRCLCGRHTYIIQSIRTLNPILSERPFYDSFPAVSTLQKCSI